MGISSPLAVIAGAGILPRLLVERCEAVERPVHIFHLSGTTLDWLEGRRAHATRLEHIGGLFTRLKDLGCQQVVFAGGVTRPQLDPEEFDTAFSAAAPALAAALAQGDDAGLRAIADLFETAGFEIIAPDHLLGGLIAKAGVLGEFQPSAADRQDAQRAQAILAGLAALDLGQGVVVAQGLCLALESLPGTDAMLGFVAAHAADLRPDAHGAKGLLYKAAKIGQDRRLDLPAIGPHTFVMAAKAGLAGVVVQDQGALILDLDGCITTANNLGLFLWVRPCDAPR